MRILVTGASGFIGARVTRVLLDAGCDVAGLVAPEAQLARLDGLEAKINLVRGDLRRRESFARAIADWKPDACIHLAWYTEPGTYLHSRENIVSLRASIDLLELLVQLGCRQVIMAGTCAEYDTDWGFLREDGPTHPNTIYAATKLSMNLIGQQIAAANGVCFAWARIFYLYGQNEDERRVIPALIRSLLKGEPFPATNGEQVRDYLHVDDVASAFHTLVRHKASGVFNVASGSPVTMRQLMETVGRIVGRVDLIKFGAIPYRDWEPEFICGDNRRLRAMGWSPLYTLEEGISDVVAWWREKLSLEIKA